VRVDDHTADVELTMEAVKQPLIASPSTIAGSSQRGLTLPEVSGPQVGKGIPPAGFGFRASFPQVP